jgi:hypothetical protein
MQQADLYSKPPEYTIDSSSLMAMFNDEPWTSKKTTPGLWERVSELIRMGIIISHLEVLAEIKKDGKKGEELFNWANSNKAVFKMHDDSNEGNVIRAMSTKYRTFVNNFGKASDAYADPWLIAQAKCLRIRIISQETMSGSIRKPKLPNVCTDPTFNINCIGLWELAKELGWIFR